MSNGAFAVWTIILALPLPFLLARDRIKGLCYAEFLLVAVPEYLRIETYGAIPEITLERVVLVVLLWFWLKDRKRQRGTGIQTPCRKSLLVFMLVNAISLLGAFNFGVSFNRFLDTAFEVGAFYFVVTTYVRERSDALRLLRSGWLGISFVAVLGVIEKYSSFRVLSLFPSFLSSGAYHLGDVSATFPQRILLGTAMAMGWPLAMAVGLAGKDRFLRKMGTLLSVALILAVCYFANSRGPWLAAAGAGGILILLGSKRLRKPLIVCGCLGVALLFTRPGVLQSLRGKADATFNASSFKGDTFLYRLQLWEIAAHEVSKSGWRTLFGYGPGAGSAMDIEWRMPYSDHSSTITSWDNQYAYNLLETGIVGLLATLVFYFGVAARTFSLWRKATQPERDLLACSLATMAALLFMRSNVLIFAPQLDFLFFSVVAAAYALGGSYAKNPLAAAPAAEDREATDLEGPPLATLPETGSN